MNRFLVLATLWIACGTSAKPTTTASPAPSSAIAADAAPAPSLKFRSDFTHDTLAQFEIIDTTTPKEGPSRWSVRAGALQQDSNIFGLPDPANGMTNPYAGSLAILRDVTATDLTYVTTFKPSDNDGAGVVFGFKDGTHYFRLISIGAANNGGPITRLDRIEGEKVTVLASSPQHYVGKASNTIRIVVRGADITAAINETTLHASDTTYAGGRLGVCVYAEQGIGFTSLAIDP